MVIHDDPVHPDKLAKAAQGGDQEAYGELVRQMMSPIMALTYRLTGDKDAAADLVQETFVVAWKELAQWDGRGAVKSWIWKIASNRSLNFLESRKRRTKLESASAQEETTSMSAAPDNLMEREELEKGVLSFMGTLPPQQRLVFDLRFYQHLQFEEISHVTGRAIGTAKTLYREAIAKLRVHAIKEGWR